MRYCLILILLIAHTWVLGHQTGHHDRSVAPVFNRWTLADGSEFLGNFLYGNSDRVVLETDSGHRVVMAFSAFSKFDQKLLKWKTDRAVAINTRTSLRDVSEVAGMHNGLVFIMLTCVFLILIWLARLLKKDSVVFGFKSMALRGLAFAGTSLLLFATCKKDQTNQTVVVTDVAIPRTRVSFLDSSFNAYRPGVSTRSDNTWYYVESNGIPAHGMMVGISSWQQQVPIPQTYSGTNAWSIPLQPAYASVPLSTKTHLMKGAVAIAVNGIPIFNALNNRGEDAYLIGELDQWGGHCGRADDYHYHAAPVHLSVGSTNTPIAFGLDGFAVYGSKEPDGSAMAALDSCHGHLVSGGTYHYHGTANYPYVIGAMRGKVSLDPTTPAPEDQILPQAFAKPVRPATTPLKGAVITSFQSTGARAYSLTYSIAGKQGYVQYSWDLSNLYRFTLSDTSGNVTTTTYQR